jgi:capsular exopolysaccharide synthesis family protein
MESVRRVQVLNRLRRHVRLIGVTIVAGGVIGAGASYLMRQFSPLYRAEAVIYVPPSNRPGSDYEHRASLAAQVTSRSMIQTMLDPVWGRGIRETRWFRDVLHEDDAQAARSLERNLHAVARPQAPYIGVSMATSRPEETALIATQAAELFIGRQVSRVKEEVGPSLVELMRRQGEIEKDIQDQDAALQTVRQNAREKGMAELTVTPSVGGPSSNGAGLNEVELRENELALSIGQLQSEVESFTRPAPDPAPAQIEREVEHDPVLASLTEKMADLQAQLAGQLTRLGEDHRVVRQTREQIDEIQAAIRQRKLEVTEHARQADLSGAQGKLHAQQERLTQLQQLREQTQQRQRTWNETKAQYEQIREKRDELAATLNQVKSQIQSLRSLPEAPTTTELQLASPATVPVQMVLSRNVLLWTLGGVAIGLAVALTLVILSDGLNDRMRTPSDVRRFLDLPLVGLIPDAAEDRAVSDIDPYHIVRDAPYSLLGEAYRRCRTNLDVADRASVKTLLIASGDAGDGKTSLACNLAEAFVAKHENVLLIDANLRQPSLHLAFGRSGSQEGGEPRRLGLTSILTAQCDHQAAIRTSRIAGLDLIYAGPPASHPAELLAGRRMKDLIESVTMLYDHVIIDTPPVLLVSDVKVLAGLVDGTLLVFNAAATHRGAAQRTICELRDVGARLIGCVLFDVRALEGGYFRRQFKAYRSYLKPQLAANSA